MSAVLDHVNPEGTGDIIQLHSFNNSKELQKDPCPHGASTHMSEANAMHLENKHDIVMMKKGKVIISSLSEAMTTWFKTLICSQCKK